MKQPPSCFPERSLPDEERPDLTDGGSKEPTCYPDPADRGRFFYLPGAPQPECNAAGAPTVALWVTDNDARLQLGVQWRLTTEQETTLRQRIAREQPTLSANQIRLQPALVQVQLVELLMAAEDTAPTVIGTSGSSGFPPYTALFAVHLNAAAKQHAIAALHGRHGFLTVRYTLQTQSPSGAWQGVQRQADVADWFTDRRGSDHIRVIPTESLSKSEPTVPVKHLVKAPAGLAEAPVAFIQLASAGETVFLRPPAFAAVELPATEASDGPVQCTTHYTSGAPYTVALQMGETVDYQLDPAELGLARVTVNAPELQAANAHEVRVHVRYLPNGNGSGDERTIYLRGSTWEAAWWIITRHTTLQGELEVTSKVTHANGTVFSPPRYRQTTGEIAIASTHD